MELLQMVVIPALVGALTMLVMQWLKGVATWIDKQSPLVQRILVGVLAFGASKLSTLSGVTIPADVVSISPETLEGLLSWGAALLLHWITKKTSTPAAA